MKLSKAQRGILKQMAAGDWIFYDPERGHMLFDSQQPIRKDTLHSLEKNGYVRAFSEWSSTRRITQSGRDILAAQPAD